MRESARHRLVRDLRTGAPCEGKTGRGRVAADMRFAPSQRGLSLRVTIVRPAKIGPIGVSPHYSIEKRPTGDLLYAVSRLQPRGVLRTMGDSRRGRGYAQESWRC